MFSHRSYMFIKLKRRTNKIQSRVSIPREVQKPHSLPCVLCLGWDFSCVELYGEEMEDRTSCPRKPDILGPLDGGMYPFYIHPMDSRVGLQCPHSPLTQQPSTSIVLCHFLHLPPKLFSQWKRKGKKNSTENNPILIRFA